VTESSWSAYVLEVPAAVEDEVAGRLAGESLGVETQPLGEGRVRLRIYLPRDADRHSLAVLSQREREALGVPEGEWRERFEPVEDLRWAERYQASLRPFRIGSRFVVIPSATLAGEQGLEPLRLVPGMAFGTGEHPTTRLCVEALEERVARGSRWLDLGCGTGILALVALRCGAAEVLAVDNDPEAVAVAREAVALNGSGAIRVVLGAAKESAGAGFDGVVANIALPYFESSAPEVAAVLCEHGSAIVSGFLAQDRSALEAVLRRAGLVPEDYRESDGWGCTTAHRTPRSPSQE